MAIFSDTFFVLGAVFGITSVYLAPYAISSESSRCKSKRNKNCSKCRSTIVLPDTLGTLRNDESSIKLYGETTISDVLSMIRIELSKFLKADKWTIIVPKEKSFDYSSDFYEAKSPHESLNNNVQVDSLEINDIADDCTEYKDIPDISSVSNFKKKKVKSNLQKYCKEIKNLGDFNESKCTHLPRQSTFINTKPKKCPKYVILGENTIEELETFAADSDYSIITIDNDNIEFSLKKSRSPMKRLFQRVRTFLGFKRNLKKKNNLLKTNLTNIAVKKEFNNRTK